MSLRGLANFLVPHTTYSLILECHQSKLPATQFLSTNKRLFNKKLLKCYKWGVLKPVQEATPWINSFVVVEGKDKSGNLKPRISLDLTNLNKAIMREPYHFKTPEEITHLIADACIMTVCDCKKGYWHQKLNEAYLISYNF